MDYELLHMVRAVRDEFNNMKCFAEEYFCMKNSTKARERIHAVLPGRIVKCRLALGYSQTVLASMAGTSTVSISCYERGTRLPTADILAGIAAALDVSCDWLLGLTDVR